MTRASTPARVQSAFWGVWHITTVPTEGAMPARYRYDADLGKEVPVESPEEREERERRERDDAQRRLHEDERERRRVGPYL